MSARETMLHAALSLNGYGFSVIPFYHKSKVPALAAGEIQPFRSRKSELKQLYQWFSQGDHNVGLVTRTPLLILDCDGAEGRSSLNGLEVPRTPRVLTARGWHAYFRRDGPFPTKLKALPGIDILADGHQVLAPPSQHPDGPRYRWHPDLNLQTCELSVPPAWMLDLAGEAPTQTNDKNGCKEWGESVNPERPVLTCSLLSVLTDSLPLSDTRLGEVLRLPEVNVGCARFLGLPVEPVGRSFTCVLPGHQDTKPSATLWWDNKTGMLKYHDHHQVSGPAWFFLTDVYAAQCTGHVGWLHGPTLVTWQLRLLVDAGLVSPHPVQARPLPPEAPRPVQKVYEGFCHLLRCKWLHTPEAPSPFTWNFAADWCGMASMKQIGEAMEWLLRRGYLVRVGKHKGVALFLTGG